MENPNTILRASGLSLGYGNQTILREINLEVNAGEFWFFLGQNGGGKTTLLRAFLGLLRPQTGQLWVHTELGRRERIGFVPQRCDLNPTLPTTVQEFVQLGLVGITLRKEEQRERLTWALEKMGLRDLAKRSYWSLSGGQRQRALVARALVRRPTLLFLDEPTNNLDLATEEAFLRTLTTLNHQERHTLLFVTHNVTLVLRYATHVGLVHAGTVISGPRQAVLTENNLKRLYGPGEHGFIEKLVPAVALAPGETA
jgi:ABC-type Mn2+/Zn2+ transport system ATPase subunit